VGMGGVATAAADGVAGGWGGTRCVLVSEREEQPAEGVRVTACVSRNQKSNQCQ